MTSWIQSLSDKLSSTIQAQNDRLEAARERAIENPGDINTAGFPDSVAGVSGLEKPIYNAVLTGMENATGRDLSNLKKD